MNFGQLITAMITPFNEKLEIDWEMTGKLIDYLIEEQQSDAIVVSGTTGESPTLTDDEKISLFRFAVKHVAGRCKVIAGTGSNETAHSVHLTKAAQEIGVDGALLVTPYYNKPTQEGVYRHFRTIAEATTLPIILYNVPSRTVTSISVETTLRLAQIPNIVATKECASLEQMTEIVKEAPEGFILYSGDDGVTLPALSVGGHGIISVASHLVGPRMKDLIASFKAGRVEEAIRINQELYPVFKGLFNCPHPVPNPVAVKYALTLRGLPVGGVRLPLADVTEEEAAFIRKLVG
ncbi:4-hydroxy-tetrahydrodipicolinate synthase [Cohnella sp. CFH 77786]|uniref:4-hydroxy-tetrahydrodipicolinate synthase n=1 Tax=Cohnella sp. CFH 77786 TaxID=2662265 RepID=UPI001C60F19B|nr:4-hydroxy-tetrahydrodipicolinate synthase [Cohnella sp. CFH 77786]MBW5444515.1 4-hydroxy-tetrahydrodipicolinate synthase [Cohnella sp. CFH 77786]